MGHVLASTLTRRAMAANRIWLRESHCTNAALIKSTLRKFVAVACKSVSTRAKMASPRDFAGTACKGDFPAPAKVTAFELRRARPRLRRLTTREIRKLDSAPSQHPGFSCHAVRLPENKVRHAVPYGHHSLSHCLRARRSPRHGRLHGSRSQHRAAVRLGAHALYLGSEWALQ